MFRPPRKLPKFADLKGTLSQSKEADDPLYQVIQEIIERLSAFQFEIDPLLANGGSGLPPAPHHITHEPGGSDALVNAAWTNLSNTFTQSQIMQAGIIFSGTSSNPNALDYYQEGSFTPLITADTPPSSVSYTTVVGYYTRIGRVVHCDFWIVVAGISGGGGLARIRLPFTSNPNIPSSGSMSYFGALGGGAQVYTITPYMNPGNAFTYLSYKSTLSSTIDAFFPIGFVDSGTTFIGSITYFVAI